MFKWQKRQEVQNKYSALSGFSLFSKSDSLSPLFRISLAFYWKRIGGDDLGSSSYIFSSNAFWGQSEWKMEEKSQGVMFLSLRKSSGLVTWMNLSPPQKKLWIEEGGLELWQLHQILFAWSLYRQCGLHSHIFVHHRCPKKKWRHKTMNKLLCVCSV